MYAWHREELYFFDFSATKLILILFIRCKDLFLTFTKVLNSFPVTKKLVRIDLKIFGNRFRMFSLSMNEGAVIYLL